jgi:hypothetical protein
MSSASVPLLDISTYLATVVITPLIKKKISGLYPNYDFAKVSANSA